MISLEFPQRGTEIYLTASIMLTCILCSNASGDNVAVIDTDGEPAFASLAVRV